VDGLDSFGLVAINNQSTETLYCANAHSMNFHVDVLKINTPFSGMCAV
jgi:hypothetical protein